MYEVSTKMTNNKTNIQLEYEEEEKKTNIQKNVNENNNNNNIKSIVPLSRSSVPITKSYSRTIGDGAVTKYNNNISSNNKNNKITIIIIIKIKRCQVVLTIKYHT